MSNIISNLKEMCKELAKKAGNNKVKYHDNMNVDNQNNVKPFVDIITKQGGSASVNRHTRTL